jgi:hypothetical protein
MKNYDFDKDLPLGHVAENICLARIKRKYPQAYRVQGYYKGCDIVVPEMGITVEVKYDDMSQKTDRYFIETASDGSPSGLTTTESIWWVIYDGSHLIWVATEALRDILRGEWQRTFPPRGKDKSRTGILIPRDRLLCSPYCQVDIISNQGGMI